MMITEQTVPNVSEQAMKFTSQNISDHWQISQ